MSIDLVCTIGPSSSSTAVLKELLLSGMNIARLNMSHGNHDSHKQAIEAIRAASSETGKPVRIMGDLQGPKIRLGKLAGDEARLKEGETFILDRLEEPGGRERAALDNPSVLEDIRSGAVILINDGEVKLRVTESSPERIVTQVLVGGTIGSRKGVNLPGTKLRLTALTEKDKKDLQFLNGQEIDFIACSFVREASHLEEIRRFLDSMMNGRTPGIISKIETVQAVLNFRSIREASDGIMIARGDLGVELPFEQIPFIQKALLRECSRSGTYVITATHMLQSMIEHPVPTRAEVTDVFQAVLDGTRAVMLSAESSVGKYPVQSTKVLGTVASFAEKAGKEGESDFTLEALYGYPPFDAL
ncbi:pyruvate kinase [Cohnella sp.]|uniref:pyruvate kinase n=1 Tax=Cohnella sp. TaxID=1883426 RepID=UPI0035644145